MSHFTPDDEALLRQARLGLEPTSADRVRIKRKIATRLVLGAAGAALAASTSTGAEASVAAATSVATAAKLLGGLLVMGSLVGTGALALRGSHHDGAMATARTSVMVSAPASAGAPASPAEAPAALLRAAPSAAPAPATPVPPAPPAPSPAARRAVARAQTPSAASASSERSRSESAPLSGPTTVAAETELLREADASLHAGNGARALALLNEHAARFPSGILVEEREAERVAVLCALGRSAEARESATAFLRDHARSPLSVRVRGSCATP